jgi:2-polyprenyl-3-methyl-5-hydroxy-6-metoxy-1,4-benzoquinol methylase
MKLIVRNNCPICKSFSTKLIYKLSYQDSTLTNFLKVYYKNRLPISLISKYNYELIECKVCRLIYQKYVPDENFSKDLYERYISPEESLKKKEENIVNVIKKIHKELGLIKKIFNLKNNINVLEFGAGWGFWATEAQKIGLKIDCLELSKKRVEYMKNKGLKVIDKIGKNFDKYDLIYSDQTFEHIDNPKETLELLNLSLNVGGYILLNFPSAFLFKTKLKKNYRPQKDVAHPLEHLNIYNRSSIKFLIKNTNLKIVNFRSYHFFNLRYLYKDLINFLYFDSVLLKKVK